MTALAFRLDDRTGAFEEDFAQHSAQLPGAGLPWLDARRRTAMQAFAKTGVPTRRVEAWKYTDLANALDSDLEPTARVDGDIDVESPFGSTGARLVFVDGFLRGTMSANGMEIVDLGALDADTPRWVADHLGLM